VTTVGELPRRAGRRLPESAAQANAGRPTHVTMPAQVPVMVPFILAQGPLRCGTGRRAEPAGQGSVRSRGASSAVLRLAR
jgi:hypothetical protein